MLIGVTGGQKETGRNVVARPSFPSAHTASSRYAKRGRKMDTKAAFYVSYHPAACDVKFSKSLYSVQHLSQALDFLAQIELQRFSIAINLLIIVTSPTCLYKIRSETVDEISNSTANNRDVASTTTVKYKYKYKYPEFKYKYKYKYLGLKYKYKYKYPSLKYKYLVVTASTGQVHNSQCMLSFCFVNYVA